MLEAIMNSVNPFGSLRAAEYTDEQINHLWVDFEYDIKSSILDLSGATPKYIFGGKGSGKTHILRYYSYLVARQRQDKLTGVEVLEQLGALTIFYRCNHFGASKFDSLPENLKQIIFQAYVELTLFEAVVECLIDIKNTTTDLAYNDEDFLAEIRRNIGHDSLNLIQDLDSLRVWIFEHRVLIDRNLNKFIFIKKVELFESILLINNLFSFIKPAINIWSNALTNFPLVFLIDEFENLESNYQSIFNDFVRMANSFVSFRIATRPNGVRTNTITGVNESNLSGHEFLKINLDEILMSQDTKHFINNFIVNRLYNNPNIHVKINANQLFDSLDTSDLLQEAIRTLDLPINKILKLTKENFIRSFPSDFRQYADSTFSILCDDIDELILKKLNILRFCKERKNSTNFLEIAQQIHSESLIYREKEQRRTGKYATSFNHYKYDLFAQICLDARYKTNIPYAGFETIFKMSSGNPRNVLNILNKIYELLSFEGKSFYSQESIDIETQTKAINQAAKYFAEEDSNYGSLSDKAKKAMFKFAAYLATARYALNIPESSPLAASFKDEDLNREAKEVYNLAVEFSLIQEMPDPRSDRNSKQLHKLIKLNPMLSPLWNLPVVYRGDLTLNADILNAIFDPENTSFDEHLNRVKRKWNSIHIDQLDTNLKQNVGSTAKLPEQGKLPF